MNLGPKRALSILVCAFVASIYVTTIPSKVLAEQCGGFVRSSIAGEGSRVKLSLEGAASDCKSDRIQEVTHDPQPYFTYEISCSPDRRAGSEGLCSTTPCPGGGLFFAFRTIHRPDGSSAPAGSSA
jgi:hypothetical protein